MLTRRKKPNDDPRRVSMELGLSKQKGDTMSTDLPASPIPSWLTDRWRMVGTQLSLLYTRWRIYLASKFAKHGKWISHHQTRTILLCNLVIASLFYPAVVMYLLTTSEDPASSTNALVCEIRDHIVPGVQANCVTGAWTPTNIWDMAHASLLDLTGTTRSDILRDTFPVHDLRLLWDETPIFHMVEVHDDEHIPQVHMAQVLISTDAVRRGGGSPYGVLEPHVLHAALLLQQMLDAKLLGEPGTPSQCVPRNDTHACLVLSPLEYWHRNATTLLSDAHPAKSYTGNPGRAVSAPPVAPPAPHSPIPLLYSTTLSSRWPFLPLFSRAEYAVLTYFLYETDAQAWKTLVEDAAAGVAPATVTLPDNVVAGTTTLSFTPQAQVARPRLHYKVVVAGYVLLLVFIFRELVQMRRLHSRLGMAITGSVQLIIDLIMSLSLCALLGIRLTAVPWSILPFTVVVVGSETMLFMIRTVTNTPLSLTVHSRIAYGLSQVAAPITISAACDVLLLILLGWWIPVEAVSQYVLFTICALVVDYFMQMTFFVTVLSIDIQRLELAEVLMQGARVQQTEAQMPQSDTPMERRLYRPNSLTGLLLSLVRKAWRARGPRAWSMTVLGMALVSMVLMYCPTWLRQSHGWHRWFDARERPAASLASYTDATLDASPYGAVWRALNPARYPYVRVVVEPWALVSFHGTGAPWSHTHPVAGPWLEGLFFGRRSTTLFLLLLFVVGPIALSMLILSLVLNYLQQNSDKLASPSSHQAGDDAELHRLLQADDHTPYDEVHLHMTAITDELHSGAILCLSAAQHVVASADTQSSLRVESYGEAHLYALADLRMERNLPADASAIMALAVEPSEAAYIAIGQASGRVSLWDVATATLCDRPLTLSLAPVQHVLWHQQQLYSVHGDGAIYAWPAHVPPQCVAAALPHARAWTVATVHGPSTTSTWLGLASARGHLAVYEWGADARPALLGVVEPPTSSSASVSSTAPMRCALLLRPCTTELDPSDRRASPPRHTASQETKRYIILAGDHQGHLHMFALPSGKCVCTLPLREPSSGAYEGAIRSIQRIAKRHALVQTPQRVWLVEWQGVDPEEWQLVHTLSLPNARGTAVVYTYQHELCVLGLRRTTHGDARWEVWRVPAVTSQSPATLMEAVERQAVPLESLLRTAVRNSVAQGRHPPARLPLLTSRIDTMIAAPTTSSEARWYIPFGSAMFLLEAQSFV
ncbi:SREBP-SCAP complex protein [Malassezia pachydermatis]